MKYLMIGLFLLHSGVAVGAERPTDFAYGIPLTADGREALYEVALPAEVYRGVARPDLGDLRIFNGAGEVVPYALRPRRVTTTEASKPVSITLFPLRAPAGTTVDGLSISVQRRPDGTSAVQVATAKGDEGGRKAIAYLINLSGQEEVLRWLELEWSHGPGGFAGKLRVDASDDLVAWRTLVASAPMVSLEAAGPSWHPCAIPAPGMGREGRARKFPGAYRCARRICGENRRRVARVDGGPGRKRGQGWRVRFRSARTFSRRSRGLVSP